MVIIISYLLHIHVLFEHPKNVFYSWCYYSHWNDPNPNHKLFRKKSISAAIAAQQKNIFARNRLPFILEAHKNETKSNLHT